jgi:nucleoside-diphosphate-sugar epimerase
MIGKAMITGATGFIGCRLAEVALRRSIPVVALVRSWYKAAHLARLPVRMVHGDILDIGSLREGMKGCDIVFHCALSSGVRRRAQREVIVRGTADVLQAALETKIKHVVYLSTVAVYGFWPPVRQVTEGTPCRYTGDPYCDSKIDAENVALRYQRQGLPITILRPSLVYGPFESLWTERLIASIKGGRRGLVNGGKGICNSLYVDNLGEARSLAASIGNAQGEVFNISDAHTVTWKEMIEAHARALGESYLPIPEMTTEEIRSARVTARRSRPSFFQALLGLVRDPRTHHALQSIPAFHALRSVPAFARVEKMARETAVLRRPLRTLFRPGSPGRKRGGSDQPDALVRHHGVIDKEEVNFYSCDTVFSIEKAQRMLGYKPRINFEEGMRRTAEWIRWMRL